jgi:DNA repair exonuclease SbcCD ATPase subunit
MMGARQTNPAQPKCPICNASLVDQAENERVARELESRIARRHADLSSKEKKETEATIRRLEASHRKEIQDLKRSVKGQIDDLKKKFSEKERKDKQTYRKKLVQMKKSHQVQLRNLREIYDRETLRAQKDQEYAFNNQLKDIVQNYSGLASNHQKELERTKRVQDESNSVVRRKDNVIARLKTRIAKSSSELQVKELILQLNERNAMIERLHGKIRELETKLEGPRPPQQVVGQMQETLTREEEEKQKLKEYMKAIIEITRNQKLMEKKRGESAGRSASRSVDEPSTTSVDKLLGWFF